MKEISEMKFVEILDRLEDKISKSVNLIQMKLNCLYNIIETLYLIYLKLYTVTWHEHV